MGWTKAGIDQFCSRNRLDDGFASTAAENEQDIPVLIRRMIRHENSPAWCPQDPQCIQIGLCLAAPTLDVSRCPCHNSLALFLDSKDSAR